MFLIRYSYGISVFGFSIINESFDLKIVKRCLKGVVVVNMVLCMH